MKTKKKLRWNLTTKISTFLTLAVLVLFASCKEELENALESKKSSEKAGRIAVNNVSFLTSNQYLLKTTAVHYVIFENANFKGATAVGGDINAALNTTLTSTISTSTLFELTKSNFATNMTSIVVAPFTKVILTFKKFFGGTTYYVTIDNSTSKKALYKPGPVNYNTTDNLIKIESTAYKSISTNIDNSLCAFIYDLPQISFVPAKNRLPVFSSTPLNYGSLNNWGWDNKAKFISFNTGGPCKYIALFENNYNPVIEDTQNPGANFKVSSSKDLGALTGKVSTIIPDRFYEGDDDYAITESEINAMNSSYLKYLSGKNPTDGYSVYIVDAKELQLCTYLRNNCEKNVDYADLAFGLGFGSNCVQDESNTYDSYTYDNISELGTTFWSAFGPSAYDEMEDNVTDGFDAKELILSGDDAASIFTCLVTEAYSTYANANCEARFDNCLNSAAPQKTNLSIKSIARGSKATVKGYMTQLKTPSDVGYTIPFMGGFVEGRTTQGFVFEPVTVSGVAGRTYVIRNVYTNRMLEDIDNGKSSETPILNSTKLLPTNAQIWILSQSQNGTDSFLQNVKTYRYLSFGSGTNSVRTLTSEGSDNLGDDKIFLSVTSW
jgi:hypothetical protein